MVLGTFNYLEQRTESSLYRNGKVLIRRNLDGSDSGLDGVHPEAYAVEVINAREQTGPQARTCEANGFELLHAPLRDEALDFFSHDQVVHHYYRDCERLVAESTGAQVYAFDHNVRSAQGKSSKRRIDGGQEIQGPAKMVHGDYTLFSAPQRLQDLAQPPKVNDTYQQLLPAGQSLISEAVVDAVLTQGARFAIINVWRNIAQEPVQTHPLAMCDGMTVAPEDLVVFEIHYADRVGENYFAKHSNAHTFYYYPRMTRDEALLIKQWDSAGALAQSNGQQADATVGDGPCTFSFHSAFDELSAADDAPDRLSIEVRCMVIYA